MLHFIRLNTKYKILFEILKKKFLNAYLPSFCLIISKFRFTKLKHAEDNFYLVFSDSVRV